MGQGLGIGLKRLAFGVETHDPRMGVRPPQRDSEFLSGPDIRGSIAPSDERRATGGDRAVGSLCPAQAKLHHRITLGRLTDSGGLGGDERLKIDQAEKGTFQKLSLEQRTADADQRFVGKRQGAFGQGVHIHRQVQIPQVF